MTEQVENVERRKFFSYQFAAGEGETMVGELRQRMLNAAALRSKAMTAVTLEDRRALRRHASEEAETGERLMILLLKRVERIFHKTAADGFPEGTPTWEEMREDAKAEMAAEFARRLPSNEHADRLFVQNFLSSVKYLALKSVESVRKANGRGRDPSTGKPRIPAESLDAPIGSADGESRYTVEEDPDAGNLLRDAEADDLRTVLLSEMERYLRSSDTPKQIAIGRRRIEAFCLRLTGMSYDRIAFLLGVDPRTERSDVEAVGDTLIKIISAFINDGLDVTPEEIIAVLKTVGQEVISRLSPLEREEQRSAEQRSTMSQ